MLDLFKWDSFVDWLYCSHLSDNCVCCQLCCSSAMAPNLGFLDFLGFLERSGEARSGNNQWNTQTKNQGSKENNNKSKKHTQTFNQTKNQSSKQSIKHTIDQIKKSAKKEKEKPQTRNLILKIMQLPIDRPRRLLCYIVRPIGTY